MAFVHALSVTNLRNISQAELMGCAQVNLIYGPNGAGKTSVLEAISFLAMGRSFRTRKARSVIGGADDTLTVFAQAVDAGGLAGRFGVRRSEQTLDIRVDRAVVRSASALAQRLPIVVFDAEVFQLVEGGPSFRREFVDWMLFHVEHERFYPAWIAYQRALKQRNQLLRRGKIAGDELAPWDDQLASHGELLAELRKECVAAFQAHLVADSVAFGSVGSLQLVLDNGWAGGGSLADAIRASVDRDIAKRTTLNGPHRMELRFKIGDVAAKEVLSRGQIKMLASQLKLAAAKYVTDITGRKIIVLLDDLAAETDTAHRQGLVKDLVSTGFQCFLTGVFVEELREVIPPGVDKTVFHVEHGCITKEQ